ncbi:sugar ABC transporter ATP-binding protein [Halovulum sp. GXIMD14794]
MTQSPRLEMENIAKRFGAIHALTDGNLSVQAGEIHALMGANGAGKSTLMNVLGGVFAPSAGQILLDGEAVTFSSARAAARAGIAVVHQELTTLGSMTVAENVFIDAFPGSSRRIDREIMRDRTADLLALVGCHASPDMPVERLSTGDRQLLEIARAMKSDPRVIILDEPTSSLSLPERQKLFALMRTIRNRGAALIFITHFLEEIFAVCDRVTVMRDGATVMTSNIDHVSPEAVVQQMLGNRHETERIRRQHVPPGAPLLSVTGLTGGPLVNGIDLRLHRGEIVGLWGLLGSGRTETVRTLMGLDPAKSGSLQLHDEAGTAKKVEPAQLRRITGLVTEDRRGEGMILPYSIAHNISLPALDRFRTRFGLLSRRDERDTARRMIDRVGVKASSAEQPVGTLSGGNQQKVVFARWLNLAPDIYVLDEPTRGLDTGAKTEILRLIVELAERGAAILIISSELEELMRVADRYLIMRRGRIAQTLPGTADRDALMRAVSVTETTEDAA